LTTSTVGACRDQIRIVGEEIPAERKAMAVELFNQAERVVIIGFSFEPKNVQWLTDAGMVRRQIQPERFATAYRLSKGETSVARRRCEVDSSQLGGPAQDALAFLRAHDFLFDVLD
jgi:hypothetical protein